MYLGATTVFTADHKHTQQTQHTLKLAGIYALDIHMYI